MSNAALQQPKTGLRFLLNVQAGPDAGIVFQLLPPRVTIGRGPENHISLTDPRVSREAAVIEFSPDQIIITDLTTRSALSVNGQTTIAASIKDGDVVTIGSTTLAFTVEALLMSPPSALAEISGQVTQAQTFTGTPGGTGITQLRPPPDLRGFQTAKRPRMETPAVGGRTRFYVIIAVVGGLLMWLLLSGKKARSVDPGITSRESIEKDIQLSGDRVEQITKKRSFQNEEERATYEEAQKHFIAGFRDYTEGQWSRAMRSFETALAIDSNHELASRYYRLAEKKRDEMVASLVLHGRQYRDKHMYSRCSAELEKAMEEMPNKEDLNFKESAAMKQECDAFNADRF